MNLAARLTEALRIEEKHVCELQVHVYFLILRDGEVLANVVTRLVFFKYAVWLTVAQDSVSSHQ